MHRTLVALSLLTVLIGQVQTGRAQSPNAEKIQAKVILQKDSSRESKGKADSTYIELSPVAVPVAYQANTFSITPNYPRLQSPYLSGLGGQPLSDEAKQQLKKFIEHYYLNNNKHLQDIQSNPYFATMTKVLQRFGVPSDLKYLAVIESGLNTQARSYAGAVGTWQLMASTARLLGLTVNGQRDDRKDLYKSTVAAAKYLSQLHAMFGNWMLVVAAYNCGPGRMQDAISTSGSTNFWQLKNHLPQQSRRHVMKFLATTYIMKRFANFFGVENKAIQLGSGKSISFAPINQPLASIKLSGKYSLAVIAKYISMDMMQLEQLNPGLLKHLSENFSKTHYLYLPADKMILFKANQNPILNESIALMAQNDRQKAQGQ